MNEPVSKAQLFASLPPPWHTDLRAAIRERAEALAAKLVVLDDDPTGSVPVWRLGPESRFPGMPYIVFPGNVGDLQALAEVYGRMCRSASFPQHSLSLTNP